MTDFSVVLIYGSRKEPVKLEDGASTPLQIVAQKASDIYGIPITGQKLVSRGKSLYPLDKQLSELGLKNGAKVMVIGKPYNIEEDEQYKEILFINEKAKKIFDRLDSIRTDLEQFKRGFLPDQYGGSAREKLQKRCVSCNEELMCCLEELDGIIVERKPDELKECRKRAVTRIQEMMDRVDATEQSIMTVEKSDNA